MGLHTIKTDNHISPVIHGVVYHFDGSAEPVYRAGNGDLLSVKTLDCYSDQIQSPEDMRTLDRNLINPATGPIFIESAMPGDVVRISIEAIQPASTGIMIAGRGIGAFGDEISGRACRIVPVVANSLAFNESLSIAVNPMIGTIGVAPSKGYSSTREPGPHGGNLDTALITTGTRVYLPVFQEGALLALGDLHAAMGDGEVGGTGVEVGGIVWLTVDVIKGRSISNPILETSDAWVSLASADSLDAAVDRSRLDMFRLLQQSMDIPDVELAMLMSIGGSSGICQIVNSTKTARFAMPKSLCGRVLVPDICNPAGRQLLTGASPG
jgi:amidase